MNKRIIGWYIAVTGAELVAFLFEVLVFFFEGGFGEEQAFDNMCLLSIMLCAGVWLPLFAYFIGICFETKFKRLKIKPIAIGLPFAVSVFGFVWIETHPKHWGFMSGFQAFPHYVFYLICGVFSFLLLIAAIVDVVEKKKKKYAEFLAMPDILFEGRTALLLIPLTVLTVLCLTPAVIGYIRY